MKLVDANYFVQTEQIKRFNTGGDSNFKLIPFYLKQYFEA